MTDDPEELTEAEIETLTIEKILEGLVDEGLMIEIAPGRYRLSPKGLDRIEELKRTAEARRRGAG